MDMLPVDSFSWQAGRLSCLIYEVKVGSKALAEIIIEKNDLAGLQADLEQAGVLFHTAPSGPDHTTVWICRHPHVLTVLKHLRGEQLDDQVFKTWAWGKAFGYSEEAIESFISSKIDNDSRQKSV
jgi:hypothetical protein